VAHGSTKREDASNLLLLGSLYDRRLHICVDEPLARYRRGEGWNALDRLYDTRITGGISEREFMVYESEFGGSIRQIEKLPFLKDISFFVFLNDEPERCKYRVEHQRGNQSEQGYSSFQVVIRFRVRDFLSAETGIPLSYYEGLDDIHFDLFLRVMSTDALPVLVLSFGDYDDPVYCRELFADVYSGKVATPRAQFVEPYVVQSTVRLYSFVLLCV